MRLVDLNPRFLDIADDHPTHAGQHGYGVECDCPCGKCGSRLPVVFKVALDGKPTPWGEKGWDRKGDTLETLTLSPSIHRLPPPHCGWHGFLTDGEFKSC